MKRVIVDFYGIPACGKSTLIGKLKVMMHNQLSVSDKLDNYHFYEKISFGKKILSISILRILYAFRLLHIIERSGKRRHLHRLNYYKSIVVRQMFRKYGQTDLLFLDQGIVQDIVTWENSEDLHEDRYFRNALKRCIRLEEDVFYVYCFTRPETAIERIMKRKRNSGRFDEVAQKMPNELYSLYKDEIQRFDAITSILEEQKKVVIKIDMTGNEHMIAEKTAKAIINLLGSKLEKGKVE